MAEFRKGLYGVVTAAAVAATALTASAPASAQQAAQSKPQAASEQCVRKGDEIGTDARCAIERLMREEARLKAAQDHGQELQVERAMLKREAACKAAIIDAAKRGKVKIDFPMPNVGEFCPTAKRLNVPVQVSSLQAPALQ